MRKLLVLPIILLTTPALANEISLTDAMANVRKNCSGISEKLNDIKKMAGVGTAVAAVGTAVGGGAVATGIIKSKTDKLSAEVQQAIDKYTKDKSESNNINHVEIHKLTTQVAMALNDENQKIVLKTQTPSNKQLEQSGNNIEYMTEKKDALDEKSKKLGDARTGLMATATAANIAGAVISGTNKIDDDFATQIGACLGSVQLLSNTKIQASLNGSATSEEIAQADKIVSACNKYNITDVEKINNRATGATVASGIGAATGLAGTITSGVANTDQTRENADKAKNLNTASNVLAGVTTAASLTSTVFNATQISAAKRVIETAEQCEEALK